MFLALVSTDVASNREPISTVEDVDIVIVDTLSEALLWKLGLLDSKSGWSMI